MANNTNHVVGIDLGTTFSVVAFVDAQGRPTTIPNAVGNLITPSVVLFGSDGTYVGEEAVQAAAMETDRVAVCVKRDMGAKYFRETINGQHLPPEVVSSYILRKLMADAGRRLGEVRDAVITVPAYFDEPRRQATINAGRLAGINVLDIINEPTAAAIAFGHQQGSLSNGRTRGEKPVRLVVYDLGGGTFDVTVVEVTGDSFRVLATDGDVQLGGRDWDAILADTIADRFVKEHREDPRANPESKFELFRVAEQAKRSLSERQQAIVVFSHVGVRFKTTITRSEFEKLTESLLERTRITTSLVLQQAGVSWEMIDSVLLVGGSTRMPMVEQMLQGLAGKTPDRSVSADEAVAHGAALFADLLRQKKATGGSGRFSIVNVNSHSLGIVGVDTRLRRRINKILIPKNSPLPASKTRRFKTAKENQRSLLIRVVEGENEQPEACSQVGSFVIRDLPKGLPKGWPIEVSYRYDGSGCLKVSATLLGHSVQGTSEFVRNNTLTDDDLLLWGQRLRETSGKLHL